MLVRVRAGLWSALTAVTVAALVSPALAQAASPTVTSIGQSARHLTATWTLPPGMGTYYIEAADRPDTYPEGDFLLENIVLYEEPAPNATTYFSTLQLPPGTYYFHVAAIDSATCDLATGAGCDVEFSTPPSVIRILPDPAPPLPPAPAPPPPPDTVTALSALKAPARQDVDDLYVLASMAERGTITVGGTVSVAGPSKVFRFKPVSANAVPGVRAKLKPRLAKRALRAVKKALERRKKVKANVTIRAKDVVGNATTRKLTVSLKR
jgi:hypothetical protein